MRRKERDREATSIYHLCMVAEHGGRHAGGAAECEGCDRDFHPGYQEHYAAACIIIINDQ